MYSLRELSILLFIDKPYVEPTRLIMYDSQKHTKQNDVGRVRTYALKEEWISSPSR